jgi:hypothetical protein
MDTLKKSAFKLHLSLSIIVILLISGICKWLWYPSPLLWVDGTWVALFILAAVDITLGPLLTLLLVSSKKSKKELVLDGIIILSIQISALFYGLYQIEKERIWGIVHMDDVFHLVAKKELNSQQLDTTYPLPKYNSIHYGMVLNADLATHFQDSVQPLMYSPEKYRALNKAYIEATSFPQENVPLALKEKYAYDKYIFKGLAGKQRDAVVVLNNEMLIVEIALLPAKEA